MIILPGLLVEAWGLRAIVEIVSPDGILVRYPKDCGDDFLIGCAEVFPPEMLYPYRRWDEHHPFSRN